LTVERGAAASEASDVHRRCGHGCDHDRVHVLHEVVAHGGMPAASTLGGRALSLGWFVTLGRDSAGGARCDGLGQPAKAGYEGVPLGCCLPCGLLVGGALGRDRQRSGPWPGLRYVAHPPRRRPARAHESELECRSAAVADRSGGRVRRSGGTSTLHRVPLRSGVGAPGGEHTARVEGREPELARPGLALMRRAARPRYGSAHVIRA